jgi:hypothetical protein
MISSELNDRFRRKQTFTGVQIVATEKAASDRPLYAQDRTFSYYCREGLLLTQSGRCWSLEKA